MKQLLTYTMLMAFGLILLSCAQKKRFAVLSFFFDGVPEQIDSTEHSQVDTTLLARMESDSANLELNASPTIFYHDPYRKKKCMECHDQNDVGELIHKEPGLCYACHEDFRNKYQHLHGPLELGFCTVCHEPHMSKNRSLQTVEGNAICFPCHVSYEVKQPDTHVEIGEALCRKCHHPHGHTLIEN